MRSTAVNALPRRWITDSPNEFVTFLWTYLKTDTERMIRTIKEELFWLREWESERELSLELDKWVDYYNMSYLHSAHGYHTPIQAQEDYYKKREDTLLNAA